VLHRELPFLRICVPFCSGILAGLFINPGRFLFFVLFPVAIILLILALKRKTLFSDPLSGIVISVILTLTGLWLYTMEKRVISFLPQQSVVIEAVISDYPVKKENTFSVEAKLIKVFTTGDAEKAGGNILIYISKDSPYHEFIPGNVINIRCIPREIKNRGNPNEFDYKFFMLTKGFRYFAFAGKNDLLKIVTPERRSLPHRALITRNKIIGMYTERGLPAERVPLAAALTLGEKDYLDREQKQQFIDAGVMHIMAVSGLHAMILSLFIFRLLFFLKGRLNILRVLLTMFIIWGFAFVTGLTPSVLRATLMFSFLQAGTLLKRPPNGVNSVLASGFVLMLIKPSVIFEAGFLLSYSAVIFIIIFYNELYRKVTFRYLVPDFIWQSAAVTLVAQAGTLPLTISLFNRFPVWFILSNILIVPVSSVVIIAGALVPMTFPVKFLSVLFTKILGLFTWLTDELTMRVSMLPSSSIEGIGLSSAEAITLIILIFFAMRYLLFNKAGGPIVVASALLLFTSVSSLGCIRIRKTSEFIVFNDNGKSIAAVRRGKTLELYNESTEIPKDVVRYASANRIRTNNHLIDERPVLIIAGNEKIEIAGTRGKTISKEKPLFTVFRNGLIKCRDGEVLDLDTEGAIRYKLVMNAK
jgi:competence protein ComEC